MMIDDIKQILQIQTIEENTLIETLIDKIEGRVKTYVGLKTIPEDLEWIIVELTCSRYNMMGSEAVHSEQNEGIKYIYLDNLLDPYREYLDAYIMNNNLRKGFRML